MEPLVVIYLGLSVFLLIACAIILHDQIIDRRMRKESRALACNRPDHEKSPEQFVAAGATIPPSHGIVGSNPTAPTIKIKGLAMRR